MSNVLWPKAGGRTICVGPVWLSGLVTSGSQIARPEVLSLLVMGYTQKSRLVTHLEGLEKRSEPYWPFIHVVRFLRKRFQIQPEIRTIRVTRVVLLTNSAPKLGRKTSG